MWRYYFKLSLLSLQQTPILSSLMIIAIGIGIAACLLTSSIYYMMSKNPLQHKNNVLRAVQLDSWNPLNSSNGPNNIPSQVTYRDGSAVLKSKIPTHTALMYKSGVIVKINNTNRPPFLANVRMTTNGFFPLFNVPFLYGEAWGKSVDQEPEFVVVLSKSLNQKIFGGINSVGKTISLDDQIFTVIGVTNDWHPRPKIHDLTSGPYNPIDKMYIPLSFGILHQKKTWGFSNGWSREDTSRYPGLLTNERVWLQLWVQLDSNQQVDDFGVFIENYITQEKKIGRFQRPLKYELNKPNEWLLRNNVIKEDDQILHWLSFLFLFICLINAMSLLLAKFQKKAPSVGIRRALGASKVAIVSQHLYETMIIGFLGGLLGLVLYGTLGPYFTNFAMIAWLTIGMAVGFSFIASLVCGVLPAWKISHTQPARYLKTN